MGKHSDPTSQKVGGQQGNDYEPKHAGGQDAHEWANMTKRPDPKKK